MQHAFNKTFGYAPFEYTTGRTYDKHQVLLITVEDKTTDEFGLIDLVATFVDASRHISGRVNTVMFPHETVGAAVLQAYDSGNYSPL
jgi:hypothetical protein